MVTYKAELPKKTASSHVGLNAGQDLFDQDRQNQMGYLFKSGAPKWRSEAAPSSRVKLKDVWIPRRQYSAMMANAAVAARKRMKNKGNKNHELDHTKPAV